MAPEDNPADEVQPTREEYEAYEREAYERRKRDEPRTLKELAKEALDIQNASNLSGLVHGWSRSVKELRFRLAEIGVTDTEAINRHPINQLWADKLADLSRSRGAAAGVKAMVECMKLAEGP